MSFSRVAAVTGANKGIGLAIVRNLALQYPSSTFSNGPLLIYLTARDRSRGEEAIKTLQNDAQLKKAKALAADGGLATIEYYGLDISKPQSITDFASFLKQKHPDGIDIVVNNAGIAMEGFGISPSSSAPPPICLGIPDRQPTLIPLPDINVVKQTLQTNYHGTLLSTLSFLPLIRPNGRLVNISSIAGHLSTKYSPALISRFQNSRTVDEITTLMDDFTSAVERGTEKEEGWPSAAYSVSKSGVTGMTRAIALEEKKRGRGILVNSCCPGYVDTDMSKGRGWKSVDEGAETPVMLAFGDIGDTVGEFWQDKKVTEW